MTPPDAGSVQQGNVGADGRFTPTAPNAGVAQATFDGASITSEVVTIPHGLGHKPKSVVANPRYVVPPPFITISYPWTIATGNETDASFDAEVTATGGAPAPGTIVQFNWMAL